MWCCGGGSVRPGAAGTAPDERDFAVVLAKGLGKNTQRRNLTSMRMGLIEGRPAIRTRSGDGRSATLGKATPDRRRSFDSDSDDDAYGEPMRRDGLIADDRRLGAERRGRVSRLVSLCTAAVRRYERFSSR